MCLLFLFNLFLTLFDLIKRCSVPLTGLFHSCNFTALGSDAPQKTEMFMFKIYSRMQDLSSLLLSCYIRVSDYQYK